MADPTWEVLKNQLFYVRNLNTQKFWTVGKIFLNYQRTHREQGMNWFYTFYVKATTMEEKHTGILQLTPDRFHSSEFRVQNLSLAQ